MIDYRKLVAAYPADVRENVKKFGRFAQLVGVTLEPFQNFILAEFFSGRNEMLVLLPRGNGKALALDTPIATPEGWTTMDDLKAGDRVLADNGEPCRVTFATQVQHGHVCYEVGFCDGSTIIADADHLWSVYDARRQETLVVPTSHLLADYRDRGGGSTYLIPNTAPLQGPERDLPVDPYVLGWWLGAGRPQEATVAVEPGDESSVREQFEGAGFATTVGTGDLAFDFEGDQGATEALTLLHPRGHRKIAPRYLRASAQQRWSLLQGLMDSAATVTSTGRVDFADGSKALVSDVAELVVTLGMKVETRRTISRGDGGYRWHASFNCAGRSPFRLPRKAGRVSPEANDARTITSIREVESVPVRCIQVDAPSRLYLAGRQMVPTHNTTLFGLIALHHLLKEKHPAVYMAASSRDQARLLFDTAKRLASTHPEVAKRIKPRHSELRTEDGFARVLSSDAPRAHGLQPDRALIDELHAHKTPDLYVALKTAQGKRPGAQLVNISTAGYDPMSLLAQLRDKALDLPDTWTKGTLTYAHDPEADFTMLEWACHPDADLSDPAVVKEANPASFVTEKFLGQQIASPGLHDLEFARFHANVWTKTQDAWLPPRAWHGCLDADCVIPDGAQITLGIDLGLRFDCSAVVWLWRRDDGRVVVKSQVWTPPGDGTPMDLRQVEEFVVGLEQRYRIQSFAYDKRMAEYLAQRLSGLGLLGIEVPQTDTRMAPASANLYQAIVRQVLVHDGDPTLAAHVNSGATKIVQSGFRIDKQRTNRPIDALIALVMAYSVMETGGDSVYSRRDLIVL